MRTDTFIAEHTVQASRGPGMCVQNPYCVRYAVDDGQMMARQGAMVAYRGNLTIQTKKQGVKKLLKRAVTGEGSIAVTAHGQPIVIPVTPTAPVFVDTDAVSGWSTVLESSIHRSESAKSLIKGGSGEMFQLKLEGAGSVIVQPSEGPLTPDGKGGGGVADTIGDFLGG